MKTSRVRIMLLAALLGGVALPGCTWLNELNEWPPKDTPAHMSEDPGPTTPQSRLMQTSDATWLAPADPKEPAVEHTIPRNGQPSGALNRITELEMEVETLRKQMSAMTPAVDKLEQSQTALRDAVADRAAAERAAAERAAAERVVAERTAAERAAAVAPKAGGLAGYEPIPLYNPQDNMQAEAAYVAPAPVPQPAAQSQAAMALPASVSASAGAVSGIRFSDNGGKTRVVLDAPAAAEYSYAIDANTNILTVRLPQSSWGAVPSGAAGTALAGGYNAAPDGAGGTILAVRLQGPARVDMAQALPASGGKPDRIVIDLAPQ